MKNFPLRSGSMFKGANMNTGNMGGRAVYSAHRTKKQSNLRGYKK